MPAKPAFGSLSSLGALKSIADVLGEVDVRPIREAAEQPFLISFVSRDAPLARHVASLLYRGPRPQDIPPVRAVEVLTLEEALARPTFGQLVVIITREDRDNTAETQLVRRLERANTPALVCFVEAPDAPPLLRQQWLPAALTSLHTIRDTGHTLDDVRATQQLTAAIRAAKAVDALALARHLPAFREQTARSLIEETAIANAAYSASTGIVEIVPVVTLPLNVADLVVLTKNQALMSYKIALAMGMTADFRHIMPQMAAVVGGGFIFRQIARTLVGLVPGWGILPKTAIAFAGTFAMGEAIYRWCATGERLTEDALRQAYQSALARGRRMAQALLKARSSIKRRSARHGSTPGVEQAG
jgi:uncharacterized protein (DUF697 family)